MPCLRGRAFVCTIPCWRTSIRVTRAGGRTLCTQRGSGRAGTGARQGNAGNSGAGKSAPAQQGCLGGQGRSDPSRSSSLVLSGSLAQPKRDVFPLCVFAFGWFLWFLSQVLYVCASHQCPRGSPQLSFTLPASFPVKRGPDHAASHSGTETPSTTAASPRAIWKQLDCLTNN